MCKKTAKYILPIITLLLFFTAGGYVVKADEIYNLEKDGYWRPTDRVNHDFYIENIWEEECYLEGIGFQRISIKDISSNKDYTIEEAINTGIIDDKYYVAIHEGNNLLYDGKMVDLIKTEFLTLKEPIFLELNSKVKFSISIYFDPLAGNEYQNKNYEYLLYPKVYKIEEEFIPELELPQTGSNNNGFTMIISGASLVILGLLISQKNNKKVVR